MEGIPFTYKKLPLVIQMNYKRDPAHCVGNLFYWLRNYAIPGKSKVPIGYPSGRRISRKDGKLIGKSVIYVLGEFVFLSPDVDFEKAKEVAVALNRVNKVFWNEMTDDKDHEVQIVENPSISKLLKERLFNSLFVAPFGFREGREKREEFLAELFVIFSEGDRRMLKKLALSHMSITRSAAEARSFSPSE